MDTRYGLDAITYLADPPRGTVISSRSTEARSEEQERKMLLHRISAKRRQLRDLEEQLRQLGGDVECESTGHTGPLRRLLPRILPWLSAR